MTEAVLSGNLRTRISPKLEAALQLIEKLTLHPHQVQPQDIEPMRALNIGQRTIHDAILICSGFNIIDRVADALDFAIPSAQEFEKGAKFLMAFGYRMASGVSFRWPSSKSRNSELHEAEVRTLLVSVLEGPGLLETPLRRKIFEGREVSEPLGNYVRKVRQEAYKVLDGDVAALLAAGYSEDQIFESTISAVLGAGLARLKAGLIAAEINWPGISDLPDVV